MQSSCLMSFCLEWALKALISKEVSPHWYQCPIVDAISHGRPPKKQANPVLVSTIHYHHAWMYYYFLLIFIWFLSTWNHQCLGIWIRVGIRIYDYRPYLQNVIGASSEYLGSLFHHRNYIINNISTNICDYTNHFCTCLNSRYIHYINWMKDK